MTRSLNIVVASVAAPGHVNPMIALARKLARKGHRILFLTGSVFAPQVEEAGLAYARQEGLADLDYRKVGEVVPELFVTPPGPANLAILYSLFVRQIPDQADALRRAIASHAADLVIADNVYYGSLPLLLGTAPRPPIVHVGVTYMPIERADGLAPAPLGLPFGGDPRDPLIRSGDESCRTDFLQPVQAECDELLDGLGMPALPMPLLEAMIRLPAAFLQPTVPAFEYPPARPIETLHFVGALIPEPPRVAKASRVSSFERSKPVVLVTQGTFANMDLGELVGPTLEALRDEPVQVLATTGGRPISDVAFEIPANARIEPFLPFADILPKIDVLVTNGGYGTVNWALSLGKPMIVAGETEDKAEIAERVRWSGAGMNLRTQRPSATQVRDAVRSVLADASYRMHAQEMSRLFAAIDLDETIDAVLAKVISGELSRRADLLAAPD
ncbi:MAG: glycosyltransferase [Beijerinckiaceae bacterium]|nr:glycosyltransferase [Beijerinckiaceae bacterium]